MTHSSTLLNDLRVALALLTRLPLPLSAQTFTAHQTRAFWAYPAVGAVVAALAGAMGAAALWANLPPLGVAAIVIATQICTTGALHEDGLADTADGLWGGYDPERRLAIMKDSHIGSYGVLALGLSLLARAAALAACANVGPLALALAVLAAAPLSRAACVWMMFTLPHARSTGLSVSAGRPTQTACLIALTLGAALCLICGTATALLIAALPALALRQIAKSKIGGQTGDILGATQQLTELAILLTLASQL